MHKALDLKHVKKMLNLINNETAMWEGVSESPQPASRLEGMRPGVEPQRFLLFVARRSLAPLLPVWNLGFKAVRQEAQQQEF